MKYIILIISLLAISLRADAVNKKEIDRLCRSTANYSRCVRDFNQGRIEKEINKSIYRSNGPIKIKVIPYEEDKSYIFDYDLDDY